MVLFSFSLFQAIKTDAGAAFFDIATLIKCFADFKHIETFLEAFTSTIISLQNQY